MNVSVSHEIKTTQRGNRGQDGRIRLPKTLSLRVTVWRQKHIKEGVKGNRGYCAAIYEFKRGENSLPLLNLCGQKFLQEGTVFL